METAVLVGRTNVGKSTLFNRILSRGQAIVSPQAGTTRDRNIQRAVWRGREFLLVDTGGLDPEPGDPAGRLSVEQMENALNTAGVILFVIDSRTGLTASEQNFAKKLRRRKCPVILVINKVDNPSVRNRTIQNNFGFSDMVMVSAKNGSGVGDLLDIATEHLAPIKAGAKQYSLALFGKTNVGKSSLFNRLLGEERSIVLQTPHTTRDRQHELLEQVGYQFELIDTAGVRRKLNLAPRIEQQSVNQTIQTLKEIEVALLVVDGSAPLSWQDQHIGGLIAESGRAGVIVINKADLVPFADRPNFVKQLRQYLPMVSWAEVIWVSASKGEGTDKILPLAVKAAQAWNFKLSALGAFIKYLKRVKPTNNLPWTNFEQTSTQPPRFILKVRTKVTLPRAISQWIEGKLRERFPLAGTPVHVRIEGLRKG